LLGAPFSAAAVRSELEGLVERVRVTDPDVELQPEFVELDAYYGGTQLFERSLTDLSETEPLAISGRCLGMIGDVLVVDQASQRFMLSIGALVARRVQLTAGERANRVRGQMQFAF
jgi:hypothetical protein